MKRKKIVTLIFTAVILFFRLNILCSEEVSETKSIAFTKNVVVKKYKQGEVHAEPYRVQEEDTLWKILVDGYGIKDRQFYFFCRITKSLNPELKDADQLVPEQILLIPFKYITHFNIPQQQMRAVLQTVLSAPLSQVPTEKYTFSKGEHLAQVLRDMYNIPDDIIFDQYLKLVKQLNPALEDLNLVKPDQIIDLPSVAAYQLSPRSDKTADEILPDEKVHEETVSQETIEKEMVQTEAVKEELVAKKNLSKESIAAEELQKAQGESLSVSEDTRFKAISRNLPGGKEGYMESMSSIAETLQGEIHSMGDISIPLMEENRITIDTSTFPILQLTSEKRLILDHGGDLPNGLVDLVQFDPGNYEVVTLEKNEDMRSVLGKLFDAAGYFSVDKSRHPLVVGDQVQFEISGDWVIYRDEFMEDILVVNVIEKGEDPVDGQLKSSAGSFGVDMIDIYMKEEGESVPAPKTVKAGDCPGDRPSVNAANGKTLVDSLLSLLGQQYRIDHTLNLFGENSEGYDVEVKADRFFQRGGIRHIINFCPLSKKLTDVIEKQGDRILSMPEGLKDPTEAIADVLRFMQLNYDAPRPGFFDTSGNKKRVGMFIPGVRIKREKQEDILLTASPLKNEIVQFLLNHNVKIVSIGVSG
jgi:hypothetical protein